MVNKLYNDTDNREAANHIFNQITSGYEGKINVRRCVPVIFLRRGKEFECIHRLRNRFTNEFNFFSESSGNTDKYETILTAQNR